MADHSSPDSRARAALLVVGLIAILSVTYFVGAHFLAQLGTSFGWCSIEQPSHLLPGEPATVDVVIHDVSEPLQLVCHLRWESIDRKQKGFIFSTGPTPVVQTGDRCSLTFEVPADNPAMNAAFVRVFLSTSRDWKDRVNAIESGPPMPLRHGTATTARRDPQQSGIAHAWQAARSGRWQQLRGDSTPMGWLITCGYIIAALLCARRAKALASGPGNTLDGHALLVRRGTKLWWGLVAVLVVLGVNKQLDLQILLTDFVRNVARNGDWYWQRRALQQEVLLAMTTIGVGLFIVVAYWLRKIWTSYWVALVGAALLLLYIFLRVVSLHHVDKLLGVGTGPLRVHALVELCGLLLIATAALRRHPSA